MSENGKKCQSVFPKAQDDDDKLSCFVHNPKDNQFTVTEKERNQKIFTFKKLESENFYFFFSLSD